MALHAVSAYRPPMKMPAPDPTLIARKAEIVRALSQIVPGEGVVSEPSDLVPFESDGLSAYRQAPIAVVLPDTTDQVARILAWCQTNGVKVVPRGAGTSLSGGALPLADSVVVGLSKFNRVLEVDYANRCAVVQPGVTNLAITGAVEAKGFYYAPDPSSQIACTIGGNVAENSGGVHCLKYGLTTNNLLGCELVLMSGEIVRLGGKAMDADGYDLLGLVTGSEGLLGIVTEVTVRILPKPATAKAMLLGFHSVEDAGALVGDIIAAGVGVGYPVDCAALLIVELDGPEAECDELVDLIRIMAAARGVTFERVSQSEAERQAFWAGRKAAFPAVGRIAPDYFCMDGTIPRGKLPQVLGRISELGTQYGLGVANVFHAGDGNLHPLILYDADIPGDLEKAEAFGADILKLCVAVGGVLTGEHGVGVEKRDLMGEMFDETDLACQQRVKCAFDPGLLLNPGKVFPVLHRCAELGRVHVHRGKLAFPDLPRF